MPLGAILARTPPRFALRLDGSLDLSGGMAPLVTIAGGFSGVGDLDFYGILQGSFSQFGVGGQLGFGGSLAFSFRYAGRLDLDAPPLVIAVAFPNAGWGGGHIDLDGALAFVRTFIGNMPVDGSLKFISQPPNALTASGIKAIVLNNDPVGTAIATLTQDGGVNPVYDGTWSKVSGSTKAQLRTPTSGRSAVVEIKTVYGTDLGSSNFVAQVTGGELGATVLTKRVDFTVEEPTVTPPASTLKLGFGHTGIGVAAAIKTNWGVTMGANTIFTSQGGFTNWTSYAAQSSTDGVWKAGNTEIKDCLDAGILPIVTIPNILSGESYADILGSNGDGSNGIRNTAIDTVMNGIAGKLGTNDKVVIRIAHEMEQGNGWDAETAARGHSAADVDNWKNCWRYVAKKARTLIGADRVILDWCITKNPNGKGFKNGSPGFYQWPKSEYWPNRKTGAAASVGLNDATGLLYPTEDLVDVVGLDHYDASGWAGQPNNADGTGFQCNTYDKWSGRSTKDGVAYNPTHGVAAGGPYTALAFAQARGKPLAIDETGLRPWDVSGGTKTAKGGGCDNPTYVQWWYDWLHETDVVGKVLWYNWYDINKNSQEHPLHCHAIYTTTVYDANLNFVQINSANATHAASDKYKALWGS